MNVVGLGGKLVGAVRHGKPFLAGVEPRQLTTDQPRVADERVHRLDLVADAAWVDPTGHRRLAGVADHGGRYEGRQDQPPVVQARPKPGEALRDDIATCVGEDRLGMKSKPTPNPSAAKSAA